MLRRMRYMLIILALFAGCGSSQTKSHRCPNVPLRGDKVYATYERSGNVDCVTGEHVVHEWARQQLGDTEAHLPRGWRCREDLCWHGGGNLRFVITLAQP